ncbi:MAG: PaREP1 family protein [Dehalococcoidia bacterium]|nr:PaREP1 family protein [Dehalococcoidia bacterium]
MAQDGEKYKSAGRELLEKARHELAQGDLRQESEKGWGAAAQMVKAVAERRGWRHDGHAALFEVVNRMVSETGDRQLGMVFYTANGLHINFYENVMSREMVEIGLDQVERFVDGLDRLVQ